MMYNENLHEEERHLIQQIAEQTERDKIGWELTEYNPLSFLKYFFYDLFLFQTNTLKWHNTN